MHVGGSTEMSGLGFAVSFVVTLGVMVLWKAFDSWLYRRATRQQRILGSGLLFLAVVVPGVWLLPNQSDDVFFGALAGLVTSGGIDAVRRRRLKSAATR
jgi:Na+/melibiose symporter-like transporter